MSIKEQKPKNMPMCWQFYSRFLKEEFKVVYLMSKKTDANMEENDLAGVAIGRLELS